MIYLDNAASTKLAPELIASLTDCFQNYGNAQSIQQKDLQHIILNSQVQIADIIQADPQEIHFTSGATESINTAIIGGCQFYQTSGNHVITFATEHQATLSSIAKLEQLGFEVTILDVLPSGKIDIAQLKSHIRPNTLMISVNHVCNETGFVQDLKPLSELRTTHGLLLHVDASQSIGKASIDLKKTPCDYMSLSAHKYHGPQGVGALYMNKTRHIAPLLHGAHPIRSGTPAHALIALMGHAYALSKSTSPVSETSDALLQSLTIPYERNGDGVPHILNLYFPTLTPENLALIKQSIYCQQSSSCHQNGQSHVLKARGYDASRIKKSLRLSLGRDTTRDHVLSCAKILNTILK
ncbi:cysteine desulfurase [Gammaproteobacteria bacterium]|nr:cysteine desulfurase [Gammaproteobacteria bacterium]